MSAGKVTAKKEQSKTTKKKNSSGINPESLNIT